MFANGQFRISGKNPLFLIAIPCILGLLVGCTGRVRTEAHREWYKHATLLKDISLRHGDSLSTDSNSTIWGILADRDLASLADSSSDWNLDTAGNRIEIPSRERLEAFGFRISTPRTLQVEDTVRFADGVDPDTNRPEVIITRLDRSGSAPMLVTVQPESLSLVLAGIPFDSAFAPVLPAPARILARKSARFRLEFDRWVLEGETHTVEYRHAETTYDVEHEGL